ncbi:MAG: SHOCT domain-containing protein [Dehalococcoidia bacterium]
MWHMGDGWGWWMVMGWLWMIAFWGLIIWAILNFASRFGARERAVPSQAAEASAVEILKRRYARGELNDEEFEEMRRRIGDASVVGAAPSGTGRSVATS